jgi:hypothetical protein
MSAMREYNIIEDDVQDDLRDEDIMKYKDFGQLTTNYQDVINRIHKKPLYKDPKAFITLVLAIIILYLVIEAMREDEAIVNPTDNIEQTID